MVVVLTGGSATSSRYRRAAPRGRNVVERLVNRPTRWRRIAARFPERAAGYGAMVALASLMIWLGA